jgi:uncharacterized protein with HEPN domain
MSKRDIILILEDIIESSDRIADYIGDYSREEFESDQKTIDAVVRNIEIIGEDVANIPEEIRIRYLETPWTKIVGVRNIVIRRDFGVDINTVWIIIKEQIPVFKEQVSEILNEEMICHEGDLKEGKEITEIDTNGEFVEFEPENYH